ncbi:hypothetical protein [Sulfitobacter sp. S190]|uniref:hypothetical protein n=1 Tax=Sulfitobacter sp. S190 TaxID=2867022 RepID=UPI0021A94F4B|nr:hypothetical protein [Sulfitobacter sp. S190]UWR21522.1 hypothetical protein K3756_12535 [Sulfitobacter sp. S190]
MSFKKIALVAVACAGLAACGDTIGEQAIGGAAIGAGAAAVTGGSLGQGAAIGAAGNIAACQTGVVNCN